jgi:16S rRNA G527 N7-methylase RsmG
LTLIPRLVKWLIKIEKETNMTRIEMDIAYDCPIGDILEWLEKYEAKIESFIAEGPGGGNPALILIFPTADKARALIDSMECGLELDDLIIA